MSEDVERLTRDGREPVSREADPAAAMERRFDETLLTALVERLREKLPDLTFQAFSLRRLQNRSAHDRKFILFSP